MKLYWLWLPNYQQQFSLSGCIVKKKDGTSKNISGHINCP